MSRKKLDVDIKFNNGEKLIWSGKPDSKKIIGGLIGGLIPGVIIGFFAAFFVGTGLAGLLNLSFIIGAAIAFFLSVVSITGIITMLSYVGVKNTNYVVTNQRAIKKYEGIVSTDYNDVKLEKIQNTGWNQGVFEGQFNLGKVEISSAGSSGVDIKFSYIENPSKVRDKIMSLVERASTSQTSQKSGKTEKPSKAERRIVKELKRLNENLEDLKGDQK